MTPTRPDGTLPVHRVGWGGVGWGPRSDEESVNGGWDCDSVKSDTEPRTKKVNMVPVTVGRVKGIDRKTTAKPVNATTRDTSTRRGVGTD